MFQSAQMPARPSGARMGMQSQPQAGFMGMQAQAPSGFYGQPNNFAFQQQPQMPSSFGQQMQAAQGQMQSAMAAPQTGRQVGTQLNSGSFAPAQPSLDMRAVAANPAGFQQWTQGLPAARATSAYNGWADQGIASMAGPMNQIDQMYGAAPYTGPQMQSQSGYMSPMNGAAPQMQAQSAMARSSNSYSPMATRRPSVVERARRRRGIFA